MSFQIIDDDSEETLADFFADLVLLENRTLGMADNKWHRWNGKTWTEDGAEEMARRGVRHLISSLASADVRRRRYGRVDSILLSARYRFMCAGLPLRQPEMLDLRPTSERLLFGDH